jgi:Tol biopolymer transport system component
MSLPAGSRLGPYEIVSPLGAGGMGEVYRAKDPRLGREVAIKVLPASFSQDADRLRRFELEARAAGVLNHPNITAVYDIGTHGETTYVVSELLEGETLRGRLSGGALPPRRATDYALQIAHGLAAAHEKGIVHRDLKPENLFVTKDGRVKILDFGLAKLVHPEEKGRETELPTATEPGVVLGTIGYMSPEQVRGRPADVRSDIFSFGAIFYEMLAGQRAFSGASAADTMSAILTKDPPDLSATNQAISPGLDRIVRHCLEKNAEERFHSAHDVAFDLEALSGLSTPSAAAFAAPSGGRRRLLPAVAAAALLVGLAGGLAAGRKVWSRPPPAYHQLTFRRGQVPSARFAPDGQTFLFSAAWEGKPLGTFLGRLGSAESRPYDLVGAEVLSISRSGEMVVSLGRHVVGAFKNSGTLARISVAGGGAPRQILEDVHFADWGPDGESLAIVRDIGGRERLEFPVGKTLYETAGWIGHPRVSPKGDRVAFVDHAVSGDDGGKIAVVDLAGKVKPLTENFSSAQGLSWAPGGREVWFTAATAGSNRSLWAVTLSGSTRILARATAPLTLQDVFSDGRVLVTQDPARLGLLVHVGGEENERDLSWLDWTVASDLSKDGKTVLFTESGEGGGPDYSVYLRATDGSPPVRLGEGLSSNLSPDGKWAITLRHASTQPEIVLLPTGAGEARRLPSGGLIVDRADWLPDGKAIVLSARETGRGSRVYEQDLADGRARPVTPEGYRLFRKSVSPDGRSFVALGPDKRIYLYPLRGGEPVPIPGVANLDFPVQWSADGRSLFVYRRGPPPAKIFRVDVATGQRILWKELVPADPAGIVDVAGVCLTPDGASYAYSYGQILSNLLVVEGVR